MGIREYYKSIGLEDEAEFLAMTCAQLRTKAKKEKVSHRRAGRNEEYIKVEEAQKKIGDDPIYRLEYDRDSFKDEWLNQSLPKPRLDEVVERIVATINNGNVEGSQDPTNVTEEDIRKIEGGKYVNWQNKIRSFANNGGLVDFVSSFYKELEGICKRKNEEKIKRQNKEKVRKDVDFTIDLVKEELEKKPNVRDRLDFGWENGIKKHQQDFEGGVVEFQQAVERIGETGQKIIRKLTAERSVEFKTILLDCIISFKENFTKAGKKIEDIREIIKDEEGIQTTMDPTTMEEVPVLGPDGKPKGDNILKKLSCPIGDCRANKKGWGNWEQHMREHLGTDSRNTWDFVKFVKKEIEHSNSGPSLDKQRQDFIKKRLQNLNGWNELGSSEKENFWNKVNSSNPDQFDDILKEVEQLIKSKPPTDSDKNNVIKEIEKIINELGLTEAELKWGNWRKDYFQSKANIDADKQMLLNKAYRRSARNVLIGELSSRGLSVTILGINGDLVKHFEKFGNKDAIETEKQRLLQLIKTQRKDRIQEIEDNIKEIRKKLQEAGIGNKQEVEILGNVWENSYKHQRYETSETIAATKKEIIEAIDEFIAKNSADNDAIIVEIKKMLKSGGLEESILENGWESNFKGKNQNEREAEKNRLIGLIEKEIKRKKDSGEWSKEKAEEERKKLVVESVVSAKKQIQNKLVRGHQKLVVKEEEIPAENFAPYKSLEEKLSSLKSTEEVADFENNLLVVIDSKKKEKLQVIINDAISEIEKEIGGEAGIQLGMNSDFKILLKGMVDPDKIEEYKNKLLSLIKEQKGGSFLYNNKSQEPNFLKVVVIAALVILPLIIVIFIVLRARQRKLNRGK